MGSVDWFFPADMEQALAQLRDGDSQAVAGGTSLLDLFKLGHPLRRRLVDLSRLPLKEITSDDRTISIGALASNTAVAQSRLVQSECPALSQAILLGASQQIRNAASVGGNLLQATRCVYFRTPDWRCNRRAPGSGCEAQTAPLPSHAVLGGSTSCIAVNPSDLAVALLALDATVVATTSDNTVERIGMKDFYPLPGATPHVTSALPPGALITSVEIPRSRLTKRSGYSKLRGRASYEFATASVAAAVEMDGAIVSRVAVALGGIATRPWRLAAAETILTGKTIHPAAVDEFCDLLLRDADARAATRHKVSMVRGAVHRLLTHLARPDR